jgi:hypothetical protein
MAVLSDIHGNLPALLAVLAQIDAEGITHVVNLGDIVSGPLWPRETAGRLMALGWPTIAGNHERQALAAAASASSDDGFADYLRTEVFGAAVAGTAPGRAAGATVAGLSAAAATGAGEAAGGGAGLGRVEARWMTAMKKPPVFCR